MNARLFIENAENGKVDQYDLGHPLVEKVVSIIKKRVVERRGKYGCRFEKNDERESQNLKDIGEDVQNIKKMVEQINKAGTNI